MPAGLDAIDRRESQGLVILARIGRLGALLLLSSRRPAARASPARWPSGGAAYDDNLFKRISPEEMADASGTGRLDEPPPALALTQETVPAQAADSPPRPLVLGSNGWRPMAKPAPIPRPTRSSRPPSSCSSKGSSPRPRSEFAKIAKNRKGSTWGENGQYYLAESQFQRKKYVDAHDSFDKLFTDYPATAYLEKLVGREYELAQLWLAQTDPDAPPSKKLPWSARFDGRLPIIDTQGSGLKALEHVKQHQPTPRPRSATTPPSRSPSIT